MTNRQYLIEIVISNVQMTSERMPRASPGVKWPPIDCTMVCRVYSGLVPRSPKTTPSAASPAHWAGRCAAAETGEAFCRAIDSLFKEARSDESRSTLLVSGDPAQSRPAPAHSLPSADRGSRSPPTGEIEPRKDT